ncbi:MAG: hypothetical protein ACTS73_05880 [Arsenophonus sp. NEOnobi-MAG3]
MALYAAFERKNPAPVLGKRILEEDKNEYMMVASKSVALNVFCFEFLPNVALGEPIYVTKQEELFTCQCAENLQLTPCLFELVYLDKLYFFINKIPVNKACLRMWQTFFAKIANQW